MKLRRLATADLEPLAVLRAADELEDEEAAAEELATPTALPFADGVRVIGFDVSPERVFEVVKDIVRAVFRYSEGGKSGNGVVFWVSCRTSVGGGFVGFLLRLLFPCGTQSSSVARRGRGHYYRNNRCRKAAYSA